MILNSRLQSALAGQLGRKAIGPLAFLGVFIWSLGLILFSPPDKMLWAAGLIALASGILYPAALLRLFRPRVLFLLSVLVLASAWTAKVDTDWFGLAFSQAGFVSGLQMALRAVVIYVSVDGLSSSIDIPMLAGLLERAGLRGLGFSIGVAMNLLPSLRQSFLTTWYALWMRGGLRRQRWLGIKYYFTTVLSNALRQAEEIALAAEARAYTPERSRTQPIPCGALDLPIMTALAGTIIIFFML